MTFDRLYSITMPLKAVSFNTVRRAKITILFIVFICFFWTIPQLFLGYNSDKNCVSYAKATSSLGQIYYWLYTIFFFPVPFVLLLTMNSIIIHTLRKRSISKIRMSDNQGQGQSEAHMSKMKLSNRQTFTMLLLVTFAFLILSIPTNVIIYIDQTTDFTTSAKDIALIYMLHSTGEKCYYTNFGINFYLCVISGKKFRSDLVNLFKDICKFCYCKARLSRESSFSNITTTTSANSLSG